MQLIVMHREEAQKRAEEKKELQWGIFTVICAEASGILAFSNAIWFFRALLKTFL